MITLNIIIKLPLGYLGEDLIYEGGSFGLASDNLDGSCIISNVISSYLILYH